MRAGARLKPRLALAAVPARSATPLLFADQGANLAGQFFQASLLPYLAFLYFLEYKPARVPTQTRFGFQVLLVFVISTVVTGIVSKANYGTTLANVDWLHGASESLLTCSNLYVSLGFLSATRGEEHPQSITWKYPALALATAVFGSAVFGANYFGAHDPFLFGAGALPDALTSGALFALEPDNALSVPTWAIHFSSVFEWLFAMNLVWKYADVSRNEAYRGLTWGMLPLHASGVAACTYHFFYNSPSLQFLVTLQAFLTLLGNTTVAIAAARIALSTGWKPQMLLPEQLGGASSEDGQELLPLVTDGSGPPVALLVIELLLLTAITSIVVKYGELALTLPFDPNVFVAALMVALPPLVVAREYSGGGSSTGLAEADKM